MKNFNSMKKILSLCSLILAIFAGKAFAGSLGHKDKVAWDIYLFYPEKSMWKELPPQPEAYMHQLRDSWADQSCLFEKDQLRAKLTETMKSLFP